MASGLRCTLHLVLLASAVLPSALTARPLTGPEPLTDAPLRRSLKEECPLPDTQTQPEVNVDPECPLSTPPRLLFVGNSFTSFNNLTNMVKAQLVAAGCAGTTFAAHVPGGFTFENHVGALADPRSDLYALLGDGRPAETTYTHAVFQEQSQTPAFYNSPLPLLKHSYINSGNALAKLVAAAERAGVAEPTLFNTWGYRTGDPPLFADFLKMEHKLDLGYKQYASKYAPSAKVAKVGLAWKRAYQDAGSDPDAAPFAPLYANDGKHPALAGSYLSALTIANSVAGVCLEGGPVPEGIDEGTAAYLQCTACQAFLRST